MFKRKRLSRQLTCIGMMALLAGASTAQAHSTSDVMDRNANNAHFTGLARVTCFNDGSGNATYLNARVRDTSAPVPGLLVNLQLLKGGMAISTTDTVSGDASYTNYIALPGGNGVYYIVLNKTAAGARSFDLEWHCTTADGVHTGTDIIVDQFQ